MTSTRRKMRYMGSTYKQRIRMWNATETNEYLVCVNLISGYDWESDDQFMNLIEGMKAPLIEYCKAKVICSGQGHAAGMIHPNIAHDQNRRDITGHRLQHSDGVTELTEYLTELKKQWGDSIALTRDEVMGDWLEIYRRTSDDKFKIQLGDRLMKEFGLTSNDAGADGGQAQQDQEDEEELSEFMKAAKKSRGSGAV